MTKESDWFSLKTRLLESIFPEPQQVPTAIHFYWLQMRTMATLWCSISLRKYPKAHSTSHITLWGAFRLAVSLAEARGRNSGNFSLLWSPPKEGALCWISWTSLAGGYYSRSQHMDSGHLHIVWLWITPLASRLLDFSLVKSKGQASWNPFHSPREFALFCWQLFSHCSKNISCTIFRPLHLLYYYY